MGKFVVYIRYLPPHASRAWCQHARKPYYKTNAQVVSQCQPLSAPTVVHALRQREVYLRTKIRECPLFLVLCVMPHPARDKISWDSAGSLIWCFLTSATPIPNLMPAARISIARIQCLKSALLCERPAPTFYPCLTGKKKRKKAFWFTQEICCWGWPCDTADCGT